MASTLEEFRVPLSYHHQAFEPLPLRLVPKPIPEAIPAPVPTLGNFMQYFESSEHNYPLIFEKQGIDGEDLPHISIRQSHSLTVRTSSNST